MLLSYPYVISAQQTDEIETQRCGSNSVQDVEFSENISENQGNNSKSFFISPFIDFVQFSVYSMSGSRMWTLKFITSDRLTHSKTVFSFPIYLKLGPFTPT